MARHRSRPWKIYLDPPADDLLQVVPSYLKPGPTFDPDRLSAKLGRRPSSPRSRRQGPSGGCYLRRAASSASSRI